MIYIQSKISLTWSSVVVKDSSSLIGVLWATRVIDATRHPSHSIWLRCCNYSLLEDPSATFSENNVIPYLVHVCDCPSFSEGELNRNILSLEVGPACRRIIDSPQVVQVIVEASMVVLETVLTCTGALR